MLPLCLALLAGVAAASTLRSAKPHQMHHRSIRHLADAKDAEGEEAPAALDAGDDSGLEREGDFFVLMGRASKQLGWEAFRKNCFQHAGDMLEDIDYNYGDAQLETVLVNECTHEQEFPHSISTGFKDPKVCKALAGLLADARDEELKKGSLKGYESACQYFYEHHGGVVPGSEAPEPAKVKRSGAASVGPAAGLAALLLLAQ